jgi:hypothetical protein
MSTKKLDFTTVRPRSEAKVLKPGELTEAQQKAGQQVTGFLRELANARFKPAARSKPHGYLPIIEKERLNTTVLIDGQRGSGKSALLITLLDLYRRAALDKVKALREFRGKGWDIDSSYRITPVGLVDLEPLPESANLLLHLVGHLEQVVTALEGGPNEARAASAPWQGEDSQEMPSRKAWRQFVRATTLGWDGPDIRRSKLDPEAYSLEAEHSERHRIQLASAFRTFLDDLVHDYQHRWGKKAPLFLLAIDDADMNPRRSSELLLLVRKLHHPRLAFLLTGDSELFEETLRMELARKEGLKEAELSSTFQSLPQAIYDKIIPPAQRCTLPPIPVRKRLSLPSNESIQAKLEQLHMPDGSSIIQYSKFINSESSLAHALPERLRGLVSLQATLITILENAKNTPEDSRTASALGMLWELTVDASRMSASDRAFLRGLVRLEDDIHGKETRLYVDSPKLHQEMDFQRLLLPIKSPLKTFSLTLACPTRFKLFMDGVSRASSVDRKPLPEALSMVYSLASDFAWSSVSHGDPAGPTVMSKSIEGAFARIRWKRAPSDSTDRQKSAIYLTLHWPLPQWGTHKDLYLFTKGWRERLPPTSAHGSAYNSDSFAWLFLQLAIKISLNKPIDDVYLGREMDWLWLKRELRALKDVTGPPRSQAISHWVQQQLGLLAAPEANVSLVFSDGLLDCIQEVFGERWEDLGERLRQERRDRLHQALHASSKTGISPSSDLAEKVDSLLRKLNKAHDRHPFTTWVQRVSTLQDGFRTGAVIVHRDTAVDELTLQLAAIPASIPTIDLPARQEPNLSNYFTNYRKRMLGRNPLWLLDKLRKEAKLHRRASTAESVMSMLWGTWVQARAENDRGDPSRSDSGQPSLGGAPLMQTFHERVTTTLHSSDGWKYLEVLPTDYKASPDLRVASTYNNLTLEGLIASIPIAAEPLWRIAHDLKVDQDDATERVVTESPTRWWHQLKASWRGSVFWLFPVVAWPTLMEWEILEENWLAAPAGLSEGTLAPIHAQLYGHAGWLVDFTLQCYTARFAQKSSNSQSPTNPWPSLIERVHSVYKASDHTPKISRRRLAFQSWVDPEASPHMTPKTSRKTGCSRTS